MTPQLLETVTTRANPQIDPALHVWGWEITAYLFLGGIVAGIFVLAAALELVRVDEVEPDLQADLVAVRDGVIFGGGEDVLFGHNSNHYSPVDRLAARAYSTSNLFQGFKRL